MENKINIAELLKDCPKGMELDCTMYEDVYFDYVDELNNIRCYIQQKYNKTSVVFNQDGTPNSHTKSKCVIFPKGKTTWEGFVSPCKFKEGDIISNGKTTIKIDYIDDEYYYEIGGNIANRLYIKNQDEWELVKDNIKPKFKVGDRIVKKNGICIPILITRVGAEYYYSNAKNSTGVLPIAEQDDWELAPNIKPKFKVGDRVKDKNNFVYTILSVERWGYMLNDLHRTCIGLDKQDNYELFLDKFDITTLKPFDKVLVRVCDTAKWFGDFYLWYDDTEKDFPYNCVGGTWSDCIPYESNEHLLGTTDNCDEYYKIWE